MCSLSLCVIKRRKMRTLLHTHTHTHNIGCVLSCFLSFFLFVRAVCVAIFSHSLALSVVVALVPMDGVGWG